VAKILDGKALAKKFQTEIEARTRALKEEGKRPPGLAVILVGSNPASKSYVGMKEKAAKACGFETFDSFLPENSSEADVAQAIKDFNENPAIDGILLQLPLPAHLDANGLIDLIDPTKDVDGLHPISQGLLMRGEAVLKPCTPLGVTRLIDLALCEKDLHAEDFKLEDLGEASLAGKKALVAGRSVLVGKPAALLLLERNATVCIAHSKTPDMEKLVNEADIVVAAIGKAELIQGAWLKEGAIVIDVGITKVSEGDRSGKIIGDVHFESAIGRACAITPVPGGVGPMTVAMLMHNTFLSYEVRQQE
jgi:methylenetetrahydrofolate dehydrogenase (NADP+)/methenyltetrahydrofolate cyclohydrolase